jgi:hypothetical protein
MTHEHDRSGWHNFCARCGGLYWVRAADLGQTHMRRFVGPESDERHECRQVSHAEARRQSTQEK